MNNNRHPEYNVICDMIDDNSKILDLGCGDGTLLEFLMKKKSVDGSGIELSATGIQKSISKGISVIQGDIEDIILNYPDDAFNYCILSQTINELRKSDLVVNEMMRISCESIIAFYNVAHLKYRAKIFLKGRFPQSKDLPYDWLTTNIMFLSVKDFRNYCDHKNIEILDSVFLSGEKNIRFAPNLRAKLCIFKIRKKK